MLQVVLDLMFLLLQLTILSLIKDIKMYLKDNHAIFLFLSSYICSTTVYKCVQLVFNVIRSGLDFASQISPIITKVCTHK